MGPLNKREEIDPIEMQKTQKNILEGLEELGLLSEKDKGKLEYIRALEKQELNYLEYKEKEHSLTDEEKIKLQEIRESMKPDNLNNFQENANEDEDY